MLMRKVLQAAAGPLLRQMSSDAKMIVVSENNGIRKIVMNSPKTRNALSMEMMEALLESLEDTQSPALRCIVLSANGPVFSSGHNLKQLAAEGRVGHQQTFSKCAKLCMTISTADVPVVAAVDGVAAAAGCQLAAACDIVVATQRSSFSTPGANFGLFCTGPGVTISRTVGRKSAARMLLTGLPVSAEEALNMGLISHVCENDKLDETVEFYGEAIKTKSRAVIRLGKQFFYKQLELDLPSAYREGAELMADNLGLQDGQEGLRSFVEKRKPVWNHDGETIEEARKV